MFDVEITGTNSPVEVTDSLDVDYTVTNTGTETATQDIVLDILPPGSIVDDFESGVLDAYSGSTADFTVTSDAPVPEGTYSLKTPAHDTGALFMGSMPGDGLGTYPELGDTQSLTFVFDGTRTEIPGFDTIFGHSSASSYASGYNARCTGDYIAVRRADSGSSTTLTQQTVNLANGVEYTAEIHHAVTGDFTLTVYDESGAEVASVSANDTTYVTNDVYDNRGVGIRSYRDSLDVIDNWTIG